VNDGTKFWGREARCTHAACSPSIRPLYSPSLLVRLLDVRALMINNLNLKRVTHSCESPPLAISFPL